MQDGSRFYCSWLALWKKMHPVHSVLGASHLSLQ
jgi:hypothetical protein